MGYVLYNWSLEEKKMLLRKSYDAISDGGVLIVIEDIIDKDRRITKDGFLMSLNMLIEAPNGAAFSESDFEEWIKEVGFKGVEFMKL
jgi:hypothetical protein